MAAPLQTCGQTAGHFICRSLLLKSAFTKRGTATGFLKPSNINLLQNTRCVFLPKADSKRRSISAATALHRASRWLWSGHLARDTWAWCCTI
jgi:hypothetical protein